MKKMKRLQGKKITVKNKTLQRLQGLQRQVPD